LCLPERAQVWSDPTREGLSKKRVKVVAINRRGGGGWMDIAVGKIFVEIGGIKLAESEKTSSRTQ